MFISADYLSLKIYTHACTYTTCELCDENYFSMTLNVRLNAYINYKKKREREGKRR